MTTESLR